MNPVLVLCYNQIDLTKKCVDAILAQTIPVHLTVVNNGSTDATRQWLSDLSTFVSNVTVVHLDTNTAPTKIANAMAAGIFSNSDHVLGVSNDAILPPNAYSELLSHPEPLVGAMMWDQVEPPHCYQSQVVGTDVHTSVCIVRKSLYTTFMDRYGYYLDEGFFMYANDVDFKLRMIECGLTGAQTDVGCWHYGSATWRLAPPEEARRMLQQADIDRAHFTRKWGFSIGSEEYNKALKGEK